VGLAADLVDVASEVPAISFHFGHSLREIDAASSTAVLDGPDGRAEAPYDLLVAADGANSTARGLLQARCRGGAAAAAAGVRRRRAGPGLSARSAAQAADPELRVAVRFRPEKSGYLTFHGVDAPPQIPAEHAPRQWLYMISDATKAGRASSTMWRDEQGRVSGARAPRALSEGAILRAGRVPAAAAAPQQQPAQPRPAARARHAGAAQQPGAGAAGGAAGVGLPAAAGGLPARGRGADVLGQPGGQRVRAHLPGARTCMVPCLHAHMDRPACLRPHAPLCMRTSSTPQLATRTAAPRARSAPSSTAGARSCWATARTPSRPRSARRVAAPPAPLRPRSLPSSSAPEVPKVYRLEIVTLACSPAAPCCCVLSPGCSVATYACAAGLQHCARELRGAGRRAGPHEHAAAGAACERRAPAHPARPQGAMRRGPARAQAAAAFTAARLPDAHALQDLEFMQACAANTRRRYGSAALRAYVRALNALSTVAGLVLVRLGLASTPLYLYEALSDAGLSQRAVRRNWQLVGALGLGLAAGALALLVQGARAALY